MKALNLPPSGRTFTLTLLAAVLYLLGSCHSSDSPSRCLPVSLSRDFGDSANLEYDTQKKLIRISYHVLAFGNPEYDIISYDANGRIDKISSYPVYDPQNARRIVTFTYDANGLPQSANRNGFYSEEKVTYTHDDKKRLEKIEFGINSVRYEYGTGGNVSKVWVSSQGVTTGEQLAREITSYDTNRPFFADSKELAQVMHYLYLYLPSVNNPQEHHVSLAPIKSVSFFNEGAENMFGFKVLSDPQVIFNGYSYNGTLPKLMTARVGGITNPDWYEFAFSRIRYNCQ
ncbi:MAG: hypothetical protein K1X47_14345 [Cyclobacteriaceae bacterium]|nr:hypothetical protein [Cyclobacteriaceae bacterium]